MMGNAGWLIGLACLAMMAVMCIPMAVGMIRARRRRGAAVQAGSQAPDAAAGPAGPSESDRHPSDPAAGGFR